MSLGLFGRTRSRLGAPHEFYLRPPFQNPQFLGSLSALVLGFLRRLLAREDMDAKDGKSPLRTVLSVASDVSNAALIFSLLSIFALLMAMTLILPRH